MNEADRAGVRACERKVKRLVAYIVPGFDRQVAAEALAAKRGFDLAIGKGSARGVWRAGNNRAAASAGSRGVATKEAQTVQRSRFDAEKFTPRGETEMENRIG